MNNIKYSHLIPSICAFFTICTSNLNAADNFADAQNVGFNTWITESNATATQEPSEPSENGYRTLWWKFTTTKRCVVTVKTPESPGLGFPYSLNVFRGDGYDKLNIVEKGLSRSTSVSFPAEAGMTFRVCIGSYYSDTPGDATFAVLQSSWPYAAGTVLIPDEPAEQTLPNDRFDTAQVISSSLTSATVIGYLGDAQSQPDESSEKTGLPAVWYSWKAPFNGTLRISTPQAPNTLRFGHRLSVFTGSDSSSLNPIASGLALASIIGPENVDLSFPIVSGTTYRISFGFSSYLSSFGDVPFSYVIQMQATKVNPDIAVRVLNGGNLRAGSSTLSLGSQLIGKTGTKIIMVKNDGKSPLTKLRVTKSGKHASDFSIGALPTTTLNPGSETSVVVRFKPKQAGLRSAAIQIFSNDPDENPFGIKLSGIGK